MHRAVVHSVCDCGCSTVRVPYHLRDADLWFSFYPQLRTPERERIYRLNRRLEGKPEREGPAPDTSGPADPTDTRATLPQIGYPDAVRVRLVFDPPPETVDLSWRPLTPEAHA